MKQATPTKTWETTRLQYLVRHKSGRYYARVYAGGKEVRKSLGTSHFGVAKAKLAEFLKEHRERVGNNSNGEVSAKMMFGEAADIHLLNIHDNPRIRPRTRHYWRQPLAALLKTWPRLHEIEVRKITLADCKKWASTYAKTASPTNYNNTVALLRHILNVAIQAGVIYANPAVTLKRAAIRAKEIVLLSTEKFNALIAEMREGHSRDSRNCADFALGLAVTGMRRSEANVLEWRDIDFDAGEVVVRGDAETGTKNWELCRVSLIPDARALFKRCEARGGMQRWMQRFSVSENAGNRWIERVKKLVPTD